MEGYEGQPIAAALHDAGSGIKGKPKLHRPRDFYCASALFFLFNDSQRKT
jgi:hypothetical protein